MTSRWSALLVWGFAAAAAMFWALRLLVPSPPVPTQAQVVDSGPSLTGDLNRLLGAAPVRAREPTAVVPDAASRFRLTGVVSTRLLDPAAPGLALISVDGNPPQAYRVGDALDSQLRLQAVGLRSARIGVGSAPGGFLLELPPPAAPATGVPSGGPVMDGMPPGMPPTGVMPPGFVPPQAPMNQGMQPGASPPAGMPPAGMPDPRNREQLQ